jgi:hypothetical protein
MASLARPYMGGEGYRMCQIDRDSFECKDWRVGDAEELSAVGAVLWPVFIPPVFAWRNPLLSGIILPSGALLLFGLYGAGRKSKEWYIVLNHLRHEKKMQKQKLLQEKMKVAEAKLRELDPDFAKELEEVHV